MLSKQYEVFVRSRSAGFETLFFCWGWDCS